MDKAKKKRVINYILTGVVLLLGFFVLGPLVQDKLIDPNKPYILVDKHEYIAAQQCAGASRKPCDLPPVLPVEMKGISDSQTINNPSIMKLPVERVPESYLPYVHYPDNWNSYWNPFQPNGIGPILRKVLNILVPLAGVLLIVYIIYLWRMGRFKQFVERMKP